MLGLRTGDVLTEVNGDALDSLDKAIALRDQAPPREQPQRHAHPPRQADQQGDPDLLEQTQERLDE